MLYLLKFYPDVKQNPDVPDIMEYLRTLAAQDEGEDGVVEFSYQDHEWQEQLQWRLECLLRPGDADQRHRPRQDHQHGNQHHRMRAICLKLSSIGSIRSGH